ncbi:hypothetical protein V6N13_064929 [Hibiscus sabdariffa]
MADCETISSSTKFSGIAFIFSFKDHVSSSTVCRACLELVHGTLAKALFTWLLEWKAQREAGFTEQRRLPALGSGRITGRCLLGDSSWLRWLIYNWTLALFAPL